jgi:hypothetical protein
VEFTQSSRKHRIGRERMRHVLANPVTRIPFPTEDGRAPREMFLGVDDTGRRLEVMVVLETERLVVIHAMDMRAKFELEFERGQRS